MVRMRIGYGLDSHRFETEQTEKVLMVGGVAIPDHTALKGNSDADVVLHALCNALLTAIGDRSLDYITGPMCKAGITNSSEYVKEIMKKVDSAGYVVENVSIMIECKTPKITPITDKMMARISELLDIGEGRVGIAATSGENMTPFGQGVGVEARVSLLLSLKE